MIAVVPSGLIIYQSDHLAICTNPSSLLSQISTFGQVLNFCSTTKGAVTWKRGTKCHKPYRGCTHVQVHRMGTGFYPSVQIWFPVCHHIFLLLCSRVEHCKKTGKTWSLPCFRKSLYLCAHACSVFAKIGPFRYNLELVCTGRSLCLCFMLCPDTRQLLVSPGWEAVEMH